jgi:hypothetical protein
MKRTGWIAVAVSLVAAFLFLAQIPRLLRAPGDLARQVVAQREETIDLGSVVSQIRELQRLETASMQVVHVSTIRQTYSFVPDRFAGDELTLLAVGDVIAGIDLSRLSTGDIVVDGKTAVVRLPPAQLLVTRLDNRQSRVISRKTGMFRKADIQLEGRARAMAEERVRDEALRRGILQIASSSAEERLAVLIRSFGFESVRFERSTRRPQG